MKAPSLQRAPVGVLRECVCADALVVLDFLSDLANLWSVEDVENSYCILDGYSREFHASACVGLYSACPVLPQLIVLHISAPSLCSHADILTHALSFPISFSQACGILAHCYDQTVHRRTRVNLLK